MLSEKYRPTSLETMVGNEEARKKLRAWLSRWKRGARAALLVGPPGTGKTTSVHLLASKERLNLVELNASDTRTKEKLSRKIGEVLSNTSLLGERTLVFLDEVDGLAGRADYGAIDFIKESIRRSKNPVAMAANRPDADEVKKLTSVSTLIEFEPPSTTEVLAFLRRVSEKESIMIPDDMLHSIAESSLGDLRYALNALQAGFAGKKDEELTAAEALGAFFEAKDQRNALRALRAYPDQPREKVREIFTGVASVKLPASKRAEVMEVLSRADLLLGRIVRGQDWRLLRYLDPMLATDLRNALDGEGVRYTYDSVPWPLQLRIWNDSRKIKLISRLAGRRLGISERGGLVEDFPYIVRLCAEKGFRDDLVRSLNLEEPFEAFLAKEASRQVANARRQGPRVS